MGRQQRNRHPANRLGQRRRLYKAGASQPAHDASPERRDADTHEQREETVTGERPVGQNFRFEG